MDPIKVLIADDHAFFRQGLRQVCESQGMLNIIGEASDGQEAIDLTQRLQPDIILMDISMPILDGVLATQTIMQCWPEVRVIMLTVDDKDESLFQAFRAGARGYLIKGQDDDQVIEAVEAVHRGEALISPPIAARVLREFRRISQADTCPERIASEPSCPLQPIELEIMQLVVDGDANSEIAPKLKLSEKTVANRLSIIYSKMNVQNRTQAAVHALSNKWVTMKPPPPRQS